jgi:hypothetical protein
MIETLLSFPLALKFKNKPIENNKILTIHKTRVNQPAAVIPTLSIILIE